MKKNYSKKSKRPESVSWFIEWFHFDFKQPSKVGFDRKKDAKEFYYHIKEKHRGQLHWIRAMREVTFKKK